MKKQISHNVKESGFKIPKDYFNTLEDTILSEIKVQEIANTTGFTTPKNYFENLEEHIISTVSKKKPTKVIPLFNKKTLIYVSSIAAAVVLFFNIFTFENKPDWESLDNETVENYIINENISAYEIATLLNINDLKEDQFLENSLKTETMETYILDNIDMEDFTTE